MVPRKLKSDSAGSDSTELTLILDQNHNVLDVEGGASSDDMIDSLRGLCIKSPIKSHKKKTSRIEAGSPSKVSQTCGRYVLTGTITDAPSGDTKLFAATVTFNPEITPAKGSAPAEAVITENIPQPRDTKARTKAKKKAAKKSPASKKKPTAASNAPILVSNTPKVPATPVASVPLNRLKKFSPAMQLVLKNPMMGWVQFDKKGKIIEAIGHVPGKFKVGAKPKFDPKTKEYTDGGNFYRVTTNSTKETVDCLFEDITEMRRLEKQAETSRRMQTLGGMTSGVVHDLNHFMTSLYGNLSLVRLGGKLDKEDDTMLGDCEEACESMVNMTRDLVQFVKGTRVAPEPIDVIAAIQKSLSYSLMSSKVKSNLRASKTDILVTARQSQLIQLFCNLMFNAVEAMGDEGLLSVSCEQISKGNKKQVVIEIEDSGPGMKQVKLDALLGADLSHGDGLGIWISRSLAEELGGTIEAVSVPGEGTKYTVTLPAAKVPKAKKTKKK